MLMIDVNLCCQDNALNAKNAEEKQLISSKMLPIEDIKHASFHRKELVYFTGRVQYHNSGQHTKK